MPILRASAAVGFLILLAFGGAAAENNYGAVSTLSALDAGIAQRRATIEANQDIDCNSVGKLLTLMFDLDQFTRFSMYSICPSLDKGCVVDAARRLLAVDAGNLNLLKLIIARYSWSQLKVCGGTGVQHDAWLLVQHSDQDKPFQRTVLGKMREAFFAGEVSTADYAYLVDRVAMGENKPQTFGTQGHCDGQKWIPFPIADPKRLDRRRHEMGMEPEAEMRPRADILCK